MDEKLEQRKVEALEAIAKYLYMITVFFAVLGGAYSLAGLVNFISRL